jgi:hypothetical protein
MGVAALINLYFIYRFIGYRIELLQLFKTICAAGIMGASVYGFYTWTLVWWGIAAISTFGAVLVGCIVYIAAMILLRGLIEDDLRRLPMIGSVGIRFLQRIGVFKA